MIAHTAWFSAAAFALFVSVAQRAHAEAPTGGFLLSDGGGMQAGPFRYGRWGDKLDRTGLAMGGGRTLEQVAGRFVVGGRLETIARVFGSEGVSLSQMYEGYGGLRLGPVLPWAGAGVHSVTVDYLRHQFSIEALSPRAMAGVSVQLSRRVNAGVFAYSEYFWRWLGRSDYRIEGVALTVQVELSRTFVSNADATGT